MKNIVLPWALSTRCFHTLLSSPSPLSTTGNNIKPTISKLPTPFHHLIEGAKDER